MIIQFLFISKILTYAADFTQKMSFRYLHIISVGIVTGNWITFLGRFISICTPIGEAGVSVSAYTHYPLLKFSCA